MRGESFGQALRRHRTEAGLSLDALAPRIAYVKSYLSKVENGHKPPTADLARASDEALGTDGELILLADLELPRGGLRTDRQAAAPEPAEWQQVLGELGERWHVLVRVDNLDGPAVALDGVTGELRTINRHLPYARGGTRVTLLRHAARYAESVAWLHEDLCDLSAAATWTGRAMEWALESGDALMVSWTLFRRSQQATAAGEPGAAVGLAGAALRTTGLTPAMRAAILQQSAHGHALDGAEAACRQALDDAEVGAAVPDVDGDARDGHGAFCTTAYLDVQRGACWLRLGVPNRAVDQLERAVPALPEAYRRDQGAALARLAAARAANGDVAQAAEEARSALDIAGETRSARTRASVAAVARDLVAHRGVPEVADLLDQLRAG